MNDVLAGHLDRIIDIIEGNANEDHDSKIKPEWRKDPFKWARERLGLRMLPWASYARDKYVGHEWDGTKEPLYTCAQEVAKGRSVAVFSATGAGKTFLGAVMLLWFLDCWQGSQVVTLAPKKDQLSLHIWKEVGKLWHLFARLHPNARYLSGSMQIEMRPHRKDWGAVGFACGVGADEQVASRARGFHAEHLFFIVEETTGVDASLLAAVKLTCTAPHNLRLFFGNPDSNVDSLSKAASEPEVVAIRASAYDHPNVVAKDATLIPGAASLEVINKWREELGEESALFQSRARGIPPEQDMHALIHSEWLDAAIKRANPQTPEEHATLEALRKKGPPALGVDVANSEAGDKASYTFGRGAVALKLESFQCPNANEYGRQHIWPYIDSDLVKPKHVGVDNVGVGVGCLNEINRLCNEAHLNQNAAGLNGGEAYWETYAKSEKFLNLRSQMYWQARVDLQHGSVALGLPPGPALDRLRKGLLIPKWKTKNGKICVQPKEEIKEKLGHSPDDADSFVYWNWIRQAQKAINFDFDSRPVAF